MLEQKLSREFTRVAEAIPVPDNLMPSLPAVHTRRVPRVLAVAAVAAAVLLGFTPWGRDVVRAATTWVSSYRVEVVKDAGPPKTARRIMNLNELTIGETREFSGDGLPREVYRAVTVADLNGEWPIPAYMGPSPDAKVIMAELYDPSGTTVIGSSINMGWNVKVEGAERSVGFSWHRSKIDQATLDQIQDGSAVAMIVGGVTAEDVKQERVTVKGQEMTATRVGTNWTLLWYHTGGSGHLAGNLDLAELIRIAESLPSLE